LAAKVWSWREGRNLPLSGGPWEVSAVRQVVRVTNDTDPFENVGMRDPVPDMPVDARALLVQKGLTKALLAAVRRRRSPS